jgi:uncharacterized protein (TIGR00251 family)
MEKIIQVKVIPRSKEAQVIEDLEGNLKVKVKALPIKGRANQELIELLSNYYNIPKTQIEIIKGFASRQKLIKISLLDLSK